MPGIYGLVDARSESIGATLDAMRECMRLRPGYVQEATSDPAAGVGLARTSLGFINRAPQPASREDGKLLAVMDGELYDSHRLAELLRKAGRTSADPSRHAELLLDLHAVNDPSLWAAVEGSFAAAIWDGVAGRLVLVNDRFGTRPLYYASLEGKLLFASTLRALLADPDCPRDTSWEGLAQFFTFGHYLGDATSFDAIRVLPAAGRLVFDSRRGAASLDRYWTRDPEATRASMARGDWLPRIDEAFFRAVERRMEGDGIGMSLSGGLDARSMLGVIDHGRTQIKTVCLGMAGSLDHRSAAQLARLAGCEHHNHILDQSFLGNFRSHLEEMIRLTDGQYLSQCIVMPTLPLYQKLGIQILLRGHAGELMHMEKAYNYSLDAAALQLRTNEDVEEWLWRRLQAYMLDGVEKPIFQGTFPSEMGRLARESLRADIRDCTPAEPPVQRIWQLFVSQRLRRETTLSLAKFRSIVEPRVPFLDNELVELLLAAPPELKQAEEIQTYILRKRRPEFLNALNANTGARMGAGPLARKFATLRMKVFAKLGLPGYQPYERLGLWLRRELAPMVREILLGEQCLDRGIFDADGVRLVVGSHLAARHNHTFLLMGMMIFELGLRYLLGEPGFAAKRVEPICH